MEMEATGAPQNHHHTLNQQVGSITASAIKLRTQAIITASTLLYQKHAERLTES